MSRKVLIIEDDGSIRGGLMDALAAHGYELSAAEDGRAGLDRFKSFGPDLILLDLMMPDMSGLDVCREIRARGSDVPIIMLTAKSDEVDKVSGLDTGADDYVTKPFGIQELLARISAALRRSEMATGAARDAQGIDTGAVFDFGVDKVDPCNYEIVRKNGSREPIGKKELQLLQLFRKYPNRVISRDEILGDVWGIRHYGTTRTLDQHIALIRKKLTDHTVIATVHGVGYRAVLPQ